ncbi:MAG: chemotaxis protein CheW [Aquabacterium sp.]
MTSQPHLSTCAVARDGNLASRALVHREVGKEMPYLTFHASGGTFALSIVSTLAIIGHEGVRACGHLPSFVRGVVEYAGKVVPVVDVTARMGFQARRAGPASRIVIVEMAYGDEVAHVGVAIDEVRHVDTLEEGEDDFIETLARRHGHYVIVMHLEQMLMPEEIDELMHGCARRQPCRPH